VHAPCDISIPWVACDPICGVYAVLSIWPVLSVGREYLTR
jgi:hypothetical protein